MAFYSKVITLTGSAIQITGSSGVNTYPTGAAARRIEIEQVRTNTHAVYVGGSDVASASATGPAIQELSIPAAGVALDRFLDVAAGSDHSIDPYQYYVNGTNTESVKITIWTI